MWADLVYRTLLAVVNVANILPHSVYLSVLCPPTSSRSARDRHRLQRLRAKQETYDPAERVVTMDELTMRLEILQAGLNFSISGPTIEINLNSLKS